MEEVDHLAHERNKAQFDVEAMKIVWAGSRHAFEVSDRMSRLVASDPVSFFSHLNLFSRFIDTISHLGLGCFRVLLCFLNSL